MSNRRKARDSNGRQYAISHAFARTRAGFVDEVLPDMPEPQEWESLEPLDAAALAPEVPEGVGYHGTEALLVLARRQERQARDFMAQAVATAREQGMTWTRIGELIGTSRQAAQQRFAAR